MQEYGDFGKKILIVNQYPSKREVTTDSPMAGEASKFLIHTLDQFGIDFWKDCIKIDILDAPIPKKEAMKAFHDAREELNIRVKALKPTRILVLGGNAMDTLLGARFTGRLKIKPYDKWIGWEIPDQELGAYIYPVEHPFDLMMQLYDQKKRLMEYERYKPYYGSIWTDKQVIKKDDYVIHKKYFYKHIQAMSKQDRAPYIHHYESEGDYVLDVEEACNAIKYFLNKEVVAFDYETTGIKAYRKGHKILSVSFSDGMWSVGMPFFRDNPKFMMLFKRFLSSKKVKKIAHNIKYEATWSKVLVDTELNNWYIDPMIAMHVYDNRAGVTGLKFLTYVMYGVIGYDDEVDKYIKTSKIEKELFGTNGFNDMENCPIDKMCKYCALDSKFTFLLALFFKAEVLEHPHLKHGYELLLEGTKCFYEIEMHGMKVNMPLLLQNMAEITDRVYTIKEKILSCKEVEVWNKLKKREQRIARNRFNTKQKQLTTWREAKEENKVNTSALKKSRRKIKKDFGEDSVEFKTVNENIRVCEEDIKEELKTRGKKIQAVKAVLIKDEDIIFNFSSGLQLRTLLYDLLEYECTDYTEKKEPSTDTKALEKVKHRTGSELIGYIQDIRKLKKVNETFLSGIKKETVDGILHGEINMTTVSTYRSSSSNPNLQNMPKHDEMAKHYIRGVIEPMYADGKLMESDYGQSEVRGIASLSLDENLLAYVSDPNSDMHRDTAGEAFDMDPALIDKDIRQITKNRMTFPLFYGSWYKPIAEALWEALTSKSDTSVSDELKVKYMAHLQSRGLGVYEDFEKHIQKVVDDYWNVKFPGVKQWRIDNWNKYIKTGEVLIPSGFRCVGFMSKNLANNAPAQGGSFHMLLFSLIQLHRFLKRNNMRSYIGIQIHDSIVLEAPDDEREILTKKAGEFMLKTSRDYYKWFVAPMAVDMDTYPGNWGTKADSEEIMYDPDFKAMLNGKELT